MDQIEALDTDTLNLLTGIETIYSNMSTSIGNLALPNTGSGTELWTKAKSEGGLADYVVSLSPDALYPLGSSSIAHTISDFAGATGKTFKLFVQANKASGLSNVTSLLSEPVILSYATASTSALSDMGGSVSQRTTQSSGDSSSLTTLNWGGSNNSRN